MKTNIKYKNSVFTLLFSDPDLLRKLYCALDGISLAPDVPVIINTLENALFMGQYNDISFEIGGRLIVLIEHQSTINPNMALRLLMYIGRVYEKLINGRGIYSKKSLSIPQPEFFVLYNGTDQFPDKETYRLSDSFEKLKNLGLEEKNTPTLELVVRVININEGRNHDIAARCKELSEYSAFVSKARSFIEELGNKEEAIREAIKYCEKHGILGEFLKHHATEVLSMLFTEFNLDDAIAVAREESREDEKLEIAKNLLAEGSTLEFVQKITGLDLDTLKGLQADI
ncbi:MAG: Rpn family recombination-promoting nuclease/putative transposase [Treponema sp.]|jgi:predicted transposase/invertase (TIGR01784 family)|nr:Rpn family recombination-promoting nuclease/putative transposase [Treponema sp.]